MYLYIRKTRHVFKSKVYTPNHCLWVNQILHASDILAALALVVKDLIVGKKTSKARLEQAWIILWATSIINCSPFLSIPNISNIDIDQCIPSWQMWQMWHSMANVNIFWHFHGKILTFIRVPDPRFEEDCQGLQAPELAIAHPIGGFLECHGWCWNTKHLRQVDGRFLTWNAFPFSWSVFQSGHISFAIRQRFFVAQAICSVRQWQCQLNGNDTFKTFPFAICFFFRFCLELWQLVSLLPCFWNRNRKRAQPKALGQRTMATGHPIACLITVSRRTPDLQKRSALAIDGVSRWVALV